MTLDERVLYLLLGVEVGFFLGYFTRMLREIREGVKEVDRFLKMSPSRKRDERGVVGRQAVQNFALLLVVFITAFAAFSSQKASNDADESLKQTKANQAQLERVVTCIISSQTELFDAINTRTTYTQGQAVANKTLQKAQRVFFGVLLHRPPYTEVKREKAAREYQDALDAFLDAANASENNAKFTKYPQAEDLLMCIEAETKE